MALIPRNILVLKFITWSHICLTLSLTCFVMVVVKFFIKKSRNYGKDWLYWYLTQVQLYNSDHSMKTKVGLFQLFLAHIKLFVEFYQKLLGLVFKAIFFLFSLFNYINQKHIWLTFINISTNFNKESNAFYTTSEYWYQTSLQPISL